MEYVISAVWIALEVICCMIFYAAFFKVKRSRSQAFLLFLAVWIIILVYSNLGINKTLRQGITVLVCVVLCHLLCYATLVKSVLITIVGYIFIAIFEVAVLYGTSALLGISVAEFLWRKLSYITAVTIGKLLPILIAWLLFKFLKSKRETYVQNKWLLLSMIFPAVSVIVLITVFFQFQEREDLSLSAVVLSGVLAGANVATLYIIHNLERFTYEQENSKLLRQMMMLQSENISALERSFHTQRKLTHEFEHHLQVLQGLLENGEATQACEYLHLIRKDRAIHSYNIHSHHPVIDVILNQKYQSANESNIKMDIKANDLSNVQISNESLVVLLTNLLDNAIEGCQRVDGRRLIQCSLVHESSLFVSVKNTSLPITTTDKGIQSSKTGTEHGFGMQAISYTLNQLQAEFAFKYEDGWFVFVAEIPCKQSF